MKKAKRHIREHRLAHKDIAMCAYFGIQSHKMNSAKTTLAFSRHDEVVASVDFYDDVWQVIIRWFDKRFYHVPYKGKPDAKLYRMTLAKYKQLNGNLAK